MGKSKRRKNEKKKEEKREAYERKIAKIETAKGKKQHTTSFVEGIKYHTESPECITEKVVNPVDEKFENIVRRMTDGYQKQIEPSILMRSDSRFLPKFENIEQWERFNNLASRLNTILSEYKCDYLKSCKTLQRYYDKDSAEYRILENAIKTQSLEER